MSAGDFVRRAAAGVSSTLAQASSTVTSVAQGRKVYDQNSEALEKCTLTIKCTPKKDAMTCTSLSIKSGYLMKRNEQGQWQKRYLCTVPHMFLYYFDSDSSEQPRGIIDLELYTNISRYKNSLKIASVNEEKMRSFHLQGDDKESLNDWLTHFMRDRYFAVCEERNAYQQMQSEMTAVLDTIASQTKCVEIDKDIVEKQLEDAILAKEEAVAMLRSMLVIMGITEEEMSRLQDLNRIGHCLQTGIIALKMEVETKFFGPDEALEAEKLAHQQDVASLQEQIEMEIRARKNLEAMLLKQKKASELQADDLNNQIDTLNLNFQLIVASKVEAEEKTAALAEQRRLLIKEVKRTRGKLLETETSLDKVEGVNQKLTTAVAALHSQLNAAQAEIAALKKAAVQAEKSAAAREQAAVAAAVMAAMDAFAAGNSQLTSPSNDRDGVPIPTLLDDDAIPMEIATLGDDLIDTSGLPVEASLNAATTDSSDSGHTSEESGAPDNATCDAPVGTNSLDTSGVPVEPMSTDQLQAILAESQAVMASLKPLSVRRSSTGSGSGTNTPRDNLSASNSATNLVNSGTSDSGSSVNGGANKPSSPQALKDLGWLSPEQEKLVDTRLQLHQQQHPEVEAKYRYLSTSNTTAVSDGTGALNNQTEGNADDATVDSTPTCNSGSANNNASAYETAASTATSTMFMLSEAMSLLSSTATATINSAAGTQPAEETTPMKRPPRGIISSMFQSEKASANGVASSATGADTEQEDPERLPSAMRLNCLRCSGTVEGPKYSTCKCSVPALMPEDLASSTPSTSSSTPAKSSWGFSGMFSKSSSVFKEGLAKASQVTASNVESLYKAASASSASSSSSANTAGASSSADSSSTAETSSKSASKKEGYAYYNTVVSTPPAAAPATPAGKAAPSQTSAVLSAILSPPPQGDHEQELWGYIMGEKRGPSDGDTSSLQKQEDSAADEVNANIEESAECCVEGDAALVEDNTPADSVVSAAVGVPDAVIVENTTSPELDLMNA